MSGTTVEIKLEKREREESAAEPAVVKDSDAPAAKKLKAADGSEEAAAEAAPAPALADAPADTPADASADASTAAGEAAPAAMEEETKAGEAAEAATPAAPAVSEEKKKEKEAEALKMLEFYFGDSNFGWDRFMQSKAGKMGENLMDVSILMSFNKLKNIVKDAGLSPEEGVALTARLGEASPHLRVSEDKKQIGRAEPLTDDKKKERIARTVQTKGYKKDSSIKIEDVEKLFAETGKAGYVKICKAGGTKLTSIFVEFETKEQADKAIEQSEKFSYEGEAVSVRAAKWDGDKSTPAEGEAPAPGAEVVYEAGKILHIMDIPESGVSRESLKDAVKSFGTAMYVDFSFGAREAWLRMENASEAAAALDAGKDGGLELAPEVEQKGTVSLLEGEDEKTYYERLEKMKAERNNRSNGRGRGKGRRGRGRGGGRGRGRGRGGGGGGSGN